MNKNVTVPHSYEGVFGQGAALCEEARSGPDDVSCRVHASIIARAFAEGKGRGLDGLMIPVIQAEHGLHSQLLVREWHWGM